MDGRTGVASNSQSTQAEDPSIVVEDQAEEREDDASSTSDNLSLEGDDDDENARLNLGNDAGELMEQGNGTQPVRGGASGYRLPDLLVGDETPGLPDADCDGTECGDGEGADDDAGADAPVTPSEKERLAAFDKEFKSRLSAFDTAIDTESLLVDQVTLARYELQARTLRSLEQEGRRAGRPEGTDTQTAENGQSAPAVPRPGEDASTARVEKAHESTAETGDQRPPAHSPDRLVSLLANRAVFLISSGQDESINDGELELVRLVKQYPALQLNQDFCNLIISGYAEMSTARELRGLSPWTTKLQLDEVAGKSEQASPADAAVNPRLLLEKATSTFFEEGIKAASPQFQRAIESQERMVRIGDRERLKLFIEGLSQDAQIANGMRKGEDMDALMERRAEQTAAEQSSANVAVDAQAQATSFRINFDFARIASGDLEQLRSASQDLEQILKTDPSIAANPQFQENLKNAYKAQAAQSRPVDSTTSDAGSAPGTAEVPLVTPAFKELELTAEYRTKEIDDEQQGGQYFSDTATNFTLAALGLGLTAQQIARTISRYHQANVTREAVRSAGEVRPIAGLAAGTMVERPLGEGVGRFEIRGETRDGRVLLSSQPASSEAETEFKTISERAAAARASTAERPPSAERPAETVPREGERERAESAEGTRAEAPAGESLLTAKDIEAYLKNVSKYVGGSQAVDPADLLSVIKQDAAYLLEGVAGRQNRHLLRTSGLLRFANVTAADLPAGESRLVISEMREGELRPIQPTGFANGKFLVKEGESIREIPAELCQTEIQIGRDTDVESASREILTRFAEVVEIVDRGSLGQNAEGSRLAANLSSLRDTFAGALVERDQQRLADADVVAFGRREGTFRMATEVGYGITKYGITIAGETISHRRLVERAVEELQKEKAALEKVAGKEAELKRVQEELARYERMNADMAAGKPVDMTEMLEVVRQGMPRELKEIRDRRRPGETGPGESLVSRGLAKGGTWALTISIVAGLVVDREAQVTRQRMNLTYAPTGVH